MKKEVIEYAHDFLKFSDIRNQFVLDAGCGIGFLSRQLELYGNNVISVDINRVMLCYGKSRFKLHNLLRCSVNHLPFKNKILDAVFLLDVIEHLESPFEVLMEIYRVLNSKGKLFLITPNRLMVKITLGKAGDPWDVRELLWGELKRLMEAAGYKIIRARAAGLPILNKIHFGISRRIANRLGRAVMPIASPSFWLTLEKCSTRRKAVESL